MDSLKTLYHGSVGIIKKPEFGKGNNRNDYGSGFYCTEDLELAKEWACGEKRGGFANVYTIDVSKINILNLSDPQYGLLDWLAVLVSNRILNNRTPIVAEAKEYLTEFFLPDISAFDAITGYRADDSYFTFAADFLSNGISLRQLSRAMRLGSLGEQFVLKSAKAFDLVQYVKSEPADGEIYHALRLKRDNEAKSEYLKRERGFARSSDEIFMVDIIRGGMKQGDARLQGDLSI
jgi:hypothetical protein